MSQELARPFGRDARRRLRHKALDVFIHRTIDGARLRAQPQVIDVGRCDVSGVRRRVTQLWYENSATGVVFTVDEEASELVGETPDLSRFNARLNVARPDCYGREAVLAFAHLVAEAGARSKFWPRTPGLPRVTRPLPASLPSASTRCWTYGAT